MRLILLLCFTVFLVAGHAAVADEHGTGPTWSYPGSTGPSHWATASPEYATCGVGKHQSPVNIVATKKTQLPPIQFNYSPSPLAIIDNGHTIQVNYAPGSSILIDSQRYGLVQFHFHRPSEEHVHGGAYPMVAHLVHKNDKGDMAVVAVLLREGKTNAFLNSVWTHLPSDKGHEETVVGATVNIAELLPVKLGYYTFEGSLTTPPCSEHVRWFVLQSARGVVGRANRLFLKAVSERRTSCSTTERSSDSRDDRLTATFLFIDQHAEYFHRASP